MKEIKNNSAENESFLATWLAGDISDKELKNLVSETDFNAYKKIKKGLFVLDALEQPLPGTFAKIENKIAQKKKQKQKKQSLRWGISIAASLLVLFGLFSTFGNSEIKMGTANAEQKTIFLLDGSEVVLNAKSEISYHKKEWDSNRVVNLTGEAFFKVKKGSTFTVKTAYGDVMVLGTEFNVNANNDYFQVTCYEGKVKVINNHKDYILKPSNSFRIINGNAFEEFNTNSPSPTWVDGESNFKSVPLKHVIFALEKQYNIEIDANNINNSLIFTGSFSHNNLEIALASVLKTMNINYKKKEKGIYILE